MGRDIPLVRVAIGIVSLFGAGSAGAQSAPLLSFADAARANSVLARARDGYDPVGIPIGAFRLNPSIAIDGRYDDNVYNVDDNRVGDASVAIVPRAVLASQWSRHRLALTADGRIERYASRKTENNEQYSVGAAGLIAVNRATAVNVDVGYARRVEARGSLGDIFAAGDRIRFDVGSARASGTVQLNDILLTVSGGLTKYDYKPVRVNETLFSQDYRDRDERSVSGRVDYNLGPSLRLFVNGSYNTQRYDTFVGIPNQDSDGYNVQAGVAFAISELISGEASAGYIKANFDLPAFASIAGFAYSGRVIWNPTTLVTVTVGATRTIEQSPLVNLAGILQDTASANADYELLRNLIVSATATVARQEYRGLDRGDKLYVGSLRGRYLLNRNVELGLSALHRFQNTDGPFGRSYSGTTLAASVVLRR